MYYKEISTWRCYVNLVNLCLEVSGMTYSDFLNYRISVAASASRERSPLRNVMCPLCGQVLKRSTT